MKHSVSKRKDCTIIKIEETIFDVRHAQKFCLSIEKILQKESRQNMIFDFSPVKAIDSSGISSMLLAHQKANQSEGIAIFVSLCKQIKDLLKLSGLDKQLYIFTSLNEVMTLIETPGKGKKGSKNSSSSKSATRNRSNEESELEHHAASANLIEEEIIDEADVDNQSLSPQQPQKKRGRPRKTPVSPTPEQ